MKISDENFRDIFRLQKIQELWDWSALEVRAALIGTILIGTICATMIMYNGSREFIILAADVAKDIGMAMIGFLGFVVTGLAILTGSISSKVVKFFKEKDVQEELNSILSSFYFLSLLIGTLILIVFCEYFVAKIQIPVSIIVTVFCIIMTIYLFIYIVFYAIGLTGNCISVFGIVTDVENQVENQEDISKKIYDSYRIIALESFILKSSDQSTISDYEEKIDELIQKDSRISEYQKNKIIEIKNRHFGK